MIRQHSAPAHDASTVTPSASELSKPAKALYVGGAGNVTVTTLGGNSVTFTAVPAGTVLPISCSHVTAATATNIVALHEE
jgi:hypothetical protein